MLRFQERHVPVVNNQGMDADDLTAANCRYDLAVATPKLLTTRLPKAAVAVTTKTPVEASSLPYIAHLIANHERIYAGFPVQPRRAMHAALRRSPFAYQTETVVNKLLHACLCDVSLLWRQLFGGIGVAKYVADLRQDFYRILAGTAPSQAKFNQFNPRHYRKLRDVLLDDSPKSPPEEAPLPSG